VLLLVRYLPVHLIPLARSLRIADLVVRIILLDEVLHDGARLEEIDSLAISEGIRQGWNATIGIYGKEPGFFLGVLGDFDLLDLVRDAASC